jgi:hypothetical protein
VKKTYTSISTLSFLLTRTQLLRIKWMPRRILYPRDQKIVENRRVYWGLYIRRFGGWCKSAREGWGFIYKKTNSGIVVCNPEKSLLKNLQYTLLCDLLCKESLSIAYLVRFSRSILLRQPHFKLIWTTKPLLKSVEELLLAISIAQFL